MSNITFLQLEPVNLNTGSEPTIFIAQVPKDNYESCLKEGYTDVYFNKGLVKEKDVFCIYSVGVFILTRNNSLTKLIKVL
ncbi:MAG: hypothetical protein RJA83_658 [Pseudomonadota bacterium]|jgi:hypothetical protein